MENHCRNVLGILDEVIDLRQEPLRREVLRALDISPYPIFVSDIYDEIIYIDIQLTTSWSTTC